MPFDCKILGREEVLNAYQQQLGVIGGTNI